MEIHLPVGIHCGPTNILRDRKIREYAYPFDWNISNKGTILNLIESQGKDFLIDENVIIGSEFKTKYENLPDKWFLHKNVFDKKTGILIVHDYKAENGSLPEIREKYRVRFERLHEHLNKATKVTLYGDKHPSFIEGINYSLWSERVGEDFQSYLPEDKTLEDIKSLISSKYNILDIQITYL